MEGAASETLELRADGTASMGGEEARWSAKAGQLTIGEDTVAYTLKADRLVLQMSGVALTYKRVGAAGKGPSPLQKAAARAQAKEAEEGDEDAEAEAMAQARAWLAANGQGQPAAGQPQRPQAQRPQAPAPANLGGGSPQDQQARQLLTSSAWCSFSYRSTGSGGSGVSSSSRVVFRPDGTMFMGTGGESYSTGSAGSVAGQSSGGSVMRWRVENLRLLVDANDGMGFQDIGLQAYQNSSGYPVLKAQGRSTRSAVERGYSAKSPPSSSFLSRSRSAEVSAFAAFVASSSMAARSAVR